MQRILMVVCILVAVFASAQAWHDHTRLVEIDRWLSEPVGTRESESGPQPLSRADALAYFLSQDIATHNASRR